jgi:hypothetical protein
MLSEKVQERFQAPVRVRAELVLDSTGFAARDSLIHTQYTGKESLQYFIPVMNSLGSPPA